MQINICHWINTRTYYLKKISSISFIDNLQNNICYILKGDLSDLWSYIVNNSDYNKIITFAHKYKFEKDINFFIAELKEKNIINTDIPIPKATKEYIQYKISTDCSQYENFNNKKRYFTSLNKILDYIYLELNYRCNLKCKHCYNPKNCNNEEINFNQAKKIIDEAYELGISTVILTGGECTINKDFLKIAKYIRKKYLELGILTNAQKLYDDPKFFNELVKIYPTLVKISLYSMNADIHDNITTVKGSFYKTISVIKKLIQKNINVKIVCPQLSYNPESYKEVKKFAKSLDCRFSTSCHFINNKNNNNMEAKLNKKYIEKFYNETVNESSPIGQFSKKNTFICDAGFNTLSINPKLDIIPCVGVNYVFGNYNKISLKELWNTSIAEFQKQYRPHNLKECFKYDYCKFCFYCLLHTCNDKGILTKSEALCEDAKIHYNAFLKLKK